MPPALQNRLHPDEALYGYWGLLVGQGQDSWLAQVPVYKPPLLPYLTAGVQLLFGDSEFTLRLPGLAAGLLTVALTAALARLLYRQRWLATPAAIVVALSPFAILFSVTVFPDPLMVVLGLGACVAAVRGRTGLAGLLAGLSLAAKQTGLAWAPLVLVLVAIQGTELRVRIVRFVIWFLAAVGAVLVWDAVRVRYGAESFWESGITGYGGLRLIWPHELSVRLFDWSALVRLLLSSPVLNIVLLFGLPALVWLAVTHRRFAREGLVDLVLVAFLVAYMVLHWLLAFPVWDRYLLPLVPIVAVLVARLAWCACRVAEHLARRLRQSRGLQQAPGLSSVWASRSQIIAGSVLVLTLAIPAVRAARSAIAVGGDHGVFDGIDQVSALLGDLPEGSVVYHHWLGWHYRYHLFRARVYLAYWPEPSWLAQDVRAFGANEPRYMAFPAWESTARVERALAREGYGLTNVLTARTRTGEDSFALYRILPLADR